jgi:hypothetical protein
MALSTSCDHATKPVDARSITRNAGTVHETPRRELLEVFTSCVSERAAGLSRSSHNAGSTFPNTSCAPAGTARPSSARRAARSLLSWWSPRRVRISAAVRRERLAELAAYLRVRLLNRWFTTRTLIPFAVDSVVFGAAMILLLGLTRG